MSRESGPGQHTRATNLREVYFQDGKSEEFNRERFRSYLRQKVKDYEHQDKKPKGKINTDIYITVDWLEHAFYSG